MKAVYDYKRNETTTLRVTEPFAEQSPYAMVLRNFPDTTYQ